MTGQLNWFKGGLLLALAFILAAWFIKPIGVSTQFVIADGVIWNLFSNDLIKENPESITGYSSKNSYLKKSGGKYARNVANPFNYGFVFVLSIILGAFISRITKGPRPTKTDREAPEVWRERFGKNPFYRYFFAFAGGIIVLYGARLAGGCTSGHMMSGMIQTSLSGFLFAIGAFGSAVPIAIMLFGRRF